jgi:hypothetical protein
MTQENKSNVFVLKVNNKTTNKDFEMELEFVIPYQQLIAEVIAQSCKYTATR